MLKTDGFGNSSSLPEGDLFPSEEFGDYTIDIDSFYAILNEGSEAPGSGSPMSPEDPLYQNLSQENFTPVAANNEMISHTQNGIQSAGTSPEHSRSLTSFSLSNLDYLEASDSRSEMTMDCFFEHVGHLGNSNETNSSFVHGRLDKSEQIDELSLSSSPSKHTSDWSTLSASSDPCSRRDSVEDSSNFMPMDKPRLILDTLLACGMADLGAQQGDLCATPLKVPFEDVDESMLSSPHPKVDNFHIMDIVCKASESFSPPSICTNFATDAIGAPFTNYDSMQLSNGLCPQQFVSNEGQVMTCIKDEKPGQMFVPQRTLLQVSVSNEGQVMSCIKDEKPGGMLVPHRTLPQQFASDEGQAMNGIKDEKQDELRVAQSHFSNSKINLGKQANNFYVSHSEPPVTDADVSRPEIPHAEVTNLNYKASGPCYPEPFGGNYTSTAGFADLASRQFFPGLQSLISSKKQDIYVKDRKQDQVLASQSMHYHSQIVIDGVQKNPSGDNSHDDSDTELCIIEEISNPRHQPPMIALPHAKSYATPQHSTFCDPIPTGVGNTRPKENDERLTFRVALQDLSQSKSEASPPDGVLAVPLLKHQRIALSWMLQKETASLHCSGGVLADDQGLGKTISVIALILSERSPSSNSSFKIVQQGEFKALNLDEDDDGVIELDGIKQVADSGHVVADSQPISSSFAARKGRPAAGTLVVCPTSVLRQWADELRNKVTSKANLTFLVYHGPNRTKDPNEVAKYDVVLTTYSIVSMEVPKQPLVDQDDEEKGKLEGHDLPVGQSTGRKRKYPHSSGKKSMKDKRSMNSTLFESVGRPLARVVWFRVILDEAQSIKNHRTQVARACWGLRAKRRWCLSGTPIQNAIDDLYSYFRFLRYDPYAVYQSFCSMIKMPISRNPTNGYKKLQAVLKTIMLRRTKGTLIDGEPIINLPPKTVSLKKVGFSEEERGFYSQLEAGARAQFKEYAAAGTVKENYVNILLMLLRLRQACDHPLLVIRGSKSLWRSSVESARKLPREQQLHLIYSLEACLAICGICNDPPEDAVVTICGHVFCNQCICEHLTGDDNSCPAANCKVQITLTKIFSKAALKSALSNEPGHDSSPDNSGCELLNTSDFCTKSLSSDSSKIKAALQILQSLSKSRSCTSECTSEKHNDMASYWECNSSSLLEGSKGLHDKVFTSAPVTEKAIVFSQWTGMLDLLEVPLRNSAIHYRRLDGTMSIFARDKALKEFNTLPEVTVMIMSLKAASLGLNMVAACHVLLLDLWWNPTTEDQAIDRAHRIGQTRPVTVSRLTVENTVEDRILALQEKKREMVASAFGEDKTGSRQTRLTVEDLRYLFMV